MTIDFLGTLPGWITAASTVTSAAAIVIAILRRGVSMKGLQNADEADIRDHYAEELDRVIVRQHECEERESQLRQRVSKLEDDILGLIRIIAQASADKVLLLDESVPEDMRKMAAQIIGRAKIK